MKNCIVLGCGRSGTSLLMSLFQSSSYFMGGTLYGPTDTNPSGYYESQVINAINELILGKVMPHRLFSKDDYLFNTPLLGHAISLIKYNLHIPIRGQRWLARVPLSTQYPENKKLSNQIEALISQSPFCFKDPRFSYTLPFWRPHLETNKTVNIVVFRHPSSTIDSIIREVRQAKYLHRRIKISEHEISQLWYLTYQHIINHSQQGRNWLFIHYEQLLDRSALSKIEEATGTIVDPKDINPNFYRSKARTEISLLNKSTYSYLCKKAGYGL